MKMKSKSLSRLGFEKDEEGRIVRKVKAGVTRSNYKPRAKQTGTPDFVLVNSREVVSRVDGFRVHVKAISVNDAFTGRRFKTPYYQQYEKILLGLLPDITLPPAPFKVLIKVGFSRANSDASNCIKQIEDICQKRYGFDDKFIYDIRAIKEIVKKGQEYIDLSIKTYNPDEQIIF